MRSNPEGDPSAGTDPKKGPTDALEVGHLRADLKSRAVSGLLVTGSTQGAKLVLQIVYLSVMSRLLTPADFGLVAMVTSITAILMVVRDGGLTTATIQRQEVSRQEITGLFWVNSALGLTLALVVAALSPAVAWFYEEPKLAQLTLLYSATFLLSGLMVQQEALIRRQMRFTTLGIIEIATLFASSLAGIATAWSGFGYWALAISVLVGHTINLVLLWLLCEWRPGAPVWPSGLNSMLKFGGHVMGFNFVSTLGMNVDKILLGRLYGAEVLGFYSRAQLLLMQPFTQILGPLGSVAIPTLSRLHHETQRFKETLLRLLLVIGFASSFASALMFAGSDWIVRIFLGEGWSETAFIFRAFAVTVFTMPISVVATWALTTAGLGKELSLWGIVNNSILLIAILCGLPWGAFGVAVAYSLSGVLLRVPLLYYFVGKKTAIHHIQILRVVGPALAAFVILSGYLSWLATIMRGYNPFTGLIALTLNTLLVAILTMTMLPWGKQVWHTISALTKTLRAVRIRNSKT